jgi:integrase
MARELHQDSTGAFVRSVGYLPSGSPRRFYLGRDKSLAAVRVAQLEAVWAVVKEGHQDALRAGLDSRLCWDGDYLAIALAVASGEPVARIQGDDDPELTATSLQFLRQRLPFVRIELEGGPAAEAAAVETIRECIRPTVDKAKADLEWAESFMRQRVGTAGLDATLHKAIAAYRETIPTLPKYQAVGGGLTQRGRVQQQHAAFLLRVLPDVALDALDTTAIDGLLDTLASRPKSLAGDRRVSREWAKDSIKFLRAFLRWLHRSREWSWKRPDDYEVIQTAVKETDDERAGKGPRQVDTFTLDQLRTLWEYARPLERAWLALGLHCGYGIGELTTLRTADLYLRQPHPHAELLDVATTADDSWILRVRPKNGVYMEHRLSGVAVQAVEWLLRHRPASDSPYLLLGKNGRPYFAPTSSGNRNQLIQNKWAALLDRIGKDLPDFPRLSFNKLRKTAADRVSAVGGDEVASVFLGHGKSNRKDTLLDNYRNRPFAKLHATLWHVGKVYDDKVFGTVGEPFPDQVPNEPAKISLGTIKRIQTMTRQGYRQNFIADKLGLSRDTVRRYARRMAGV